MATTDSYEVTIAGIELTVNRKAINNIHLSVLPPNGAVRLSVPVATSEQAIRLAVINKLSWIKQQQADFASQRRQSVREMISGESHYLWGQRYLLRIIETTGKHNVTLKSNRVELGVASKTTTENRLKLLNEFYRSEIKASLSTLLPLWQEKLGVEANDVGIKKMKTKWGSCNSTDKRIWLNLELAKKPPECLEFILVHEHIHLLERHHNDRFRSLMDEHLPDWRERRRLLNSLPLAYEDWSY
ncbi:metal-dependent hydrolase [Vibrio lentus]|uniref:M48 family metallopeptidase n=1 Tax=Vibrio lentus TaxID=136468 RepID=UPI000CB19675|nr:SprT family zinc-dependent metalloprotease [Vibrio lentus]PMN51746.1 metal-dependent hydrolase [Vibrio lentus]